MEISSYVKFQKYHISFHFYFNIFPGLYPRLSCFVMRLIRLQLLIITAFAPIDSPTLHKATESVHRQVSRRQTPPTAFPCSAQVLVTFCSPFSQGTSVRLSFSVSPTYPYPLCLAKLPVCTTQVNAYAWEKRSLPAWALPKHICPLEDELIDRKQECRRWVDMRKNCQLSIGVDLESQERYCITV